MNVLKLFWRLFVTAVFFNELFIKQIFNIIFIPGSSFGTSNESDERSSHGITTSAWSL